MINKSASERGAFFDFRLSIFDCQFSIVNFYLNIFYLNF